MIVRVEVPAVEWGDEGFEFSFLAWLERAQVEITSDLETRLGR